MVQAELNQRCLSMLSVRDKELAPFLQDPVAALVTQGKI